MRSSASNFREPDPPESASASSTDVTNSEQPPHANWTAENDNQPDTEPPIITIHGNNPAEITVGTPYADLGATVTDDTDENLGLHLFLDGAPTDAVSIDTSAASTHSIDYVATDTSGNTATSTRTVIVSAPQNTAANDNPPPLY